MEIRAGAISKGNGEGDSLRGLLQEFTFSFLNFSLFFLQGFPFIILEFFQISAVISSNIFKNADCQKNIW